jgi:transposase
MGLHQKTHTQTQSAQRRQGTAATGSPGGAQWDPLDSENRCPVERTTAREVSTAHDCAQVFPTMGQHRGVGESPEGSGRRSQQARQDQLERVLHRRFLYRGQKGGDGVGKTKRGKGTKLMAIADASGLPVALHTESAQPAEVKLVKSTVSRCHTRTKPQRLIGDKAYDSDPLAEELSEEQIELIAPHRKNRKAQNKTQDGRPLRRYLRRWKVERLFAWLQNFRRILVRHEYHLSNYHGFVQLGAIIILLRHF